MATDTLIKADTRKTTSLLKKHLKTAYGINCKIKSESYSGGSSLSITYALGVDKKEIEKFIEPLAYGKFDSMADLYNYKKDSGLELDGYLLNDFKFVFVYQELSREFWFKLAVFLSDNMGFDELPKLEKIENFFDHFPRSFGAARNWKDMIYQGLKDRHFVTQDEEKIILKSVHHSEKGLNQIYFIYTVDGLEYNTEIPNIKPVEYDIYSPDGFSINREEELFQSPEQAYSALLKWKERFSLQGFYSSNKGRIALDELLENCKIIKIQDGEILSFGHVKLQDLEIF